MRKCIYIQPLLYYAIVVKYLIARDQPIILLFLPIMLCCSALIIYFLYSILCSRKIVVRILCYLFTNLHEQFTTCNRQFKKKWSVFMNDIKV